MANDWYTKASWTEADQADFFARLKRSRKPYHKAQYLWVQGRELEKAGLLQAALTLFDKMLAEFPEPFFLALVFLQKANCLARLENLDQAIVFYRRALDAQRKYPNHITPVAKEFGRFIVEHKLTQLYDEVLAVLEEMKSPGIRFPSDVYVENGIRAIIMAAKGGREEAARVAAVALSAAAQDRSGFRYHSNFGVVKDRESKFYQAIEAIAGRNIQSFAN